MHKIAVFASVIAIILLSGCMSPKLGYPVNTVEIPTPVTLSTIFAEQGTIKTEIGFMADGIFIWAFGDYYNAQFANIDKVKLEALITEQFKEKVLAIPELFKVEAGEQINSETPPKYSLIFSVDEWGYWATKEVSDEGPFIKVSIQLYDKENNKTIWSYKSQAMEHVANTSSRGTHNAEFLQKTYEKLILGQLNKYFVILGAK